MKNAGKYVLLFLTVACAIFIFSNSLRTAGSSSAQSGRLVRIFSDAYHALIGKDVSVDNAQKIVRKTAHFTEFAVLGLLAAWTVKAFYGKIRGRVFMLCFIGLFTAVTDEFLQSFSPGRSPEVPDVLLDFAGYFTGFALVWLICTVSVRRRNKHALDKRSLPGD